MKYSSTNLPLVCMQTNSTCYKGTQSMNIVGVLWHSTGANNPNLKRYVQPFETDSNYDEMMALLGKNKYGNDINHIYREMGVNAWIGKLADGTTTLIQTLPWHYRPWGCGKGRNGSCNDGWIQFEICEDGLGDKAYCDAVYKEACEITAYLCQMYSIDPHGYVERNGVKVPTILCHKDSHDLGFGSNHGDILHWFPKFGYNMETARDDVAKLIEESKPIKQVIYRIRKDWNKPNTQIGAYSVLENAIKACSEAGSEYKVFDEEGKVIYPEVRVEEEKKPETGVVIIPVPQPKPEPEPEKDPYELKVLDVIKLKEHAVWTNKKKVPNWVKNSTLYVRKIKSNGEIGISVFKTGLITGYIEKDQIDFPEVKVNYVVKILEKLNVREKPDGVSAVKTVLSKNSAYTIIAEKNGFGKLKSGIGWINLTYTKRIR